MGFVYKSRIGVGLGSFILIASPHPDPLPGGEGANMFSSPHPSPLPGGEGARRGSFEGLGGMLRFLSSRGQGEEPSKASAKRNSCSLSPRERVGVRGSESSDMQEKDMPSPIY